MGKHVAEKELLFIHDCLKKKKNPLIENCDLMAPGGKHKQLSTAFSLIAKLEFKMSRWSKKVQIKIFFFAKHAWTGDGASTLLL